MQICQEKGSHSIHKYADETIAAILFLKANRSKWNEKSFNSLVVRNTQQNQEVDGIHDDDDEFTYFPPLGHEDVLDFIRGDEFEDDERDIE